MYEDITSEEVYPYDFLAENCPDDKKRDVDYVNEKAAQDGVTITNISSTEPMVILKHFGPNHPDRP